MNTAGTDPSRPIGEKPLKGDSEGRKTPRVLMVLVKVVGLGTDHRLSLAQNPAVRGNVARALAA